MHEHHSALVATLQKLTALKAELKAIHPQLSQYTKGLAVAKGMAAAVQLLEQLESKEVA